MHLTMERESAFRPKTQEVERTTRPEAQEKIEGPLSSLEKDKAQISSFNFALEAILSGRTYPGSFAGLE